MKIGDKFKDKEQRIYEVIDIQANGEIVWIKNKYGEVLYYSKNGIDEFLEINTPITES